MGLWTSGCPVVEGATLRCFPPGRGGGRSVLPGSTEPSSQPLPERRGAQAACQGRSTRHNRQLVPSPSLRERVARRAGEGSGGAWCLATPNPSPGGRGALVHRALPAFVLSVGAAEVEARPQTGRQGLRLVGWRGLPER